MEAAERASHSDGLSCYLLMALLALQIGVQPTVTKKFVAQAVSGTSLVLAELVVSIFLALAVTPGTALSGWSVLESFQFACPPAAIYALRSIFKQAAYRRCDGVTFNVVNQTKVVFCALGTWMLLGEGQSLRQCAALLCAVGAGAVLVAPGASLGRCCSSAVAPKEFMSILELPVAPVTAVMVSEEDGHQPDTPKNTRVFTTGAGLALATAACSGIAAALSQVALHGTERPSALFNLELAIWGLPMVLFTSNSVGSVRLHEGWEGCTLVPVVLQAAGGLLVSALVQSQGGVAAGLCTVAGIVVSAAIEAAATRSPPSLRKVVAAGLCGVSVAVHQLDDEDSPISMSIHHHSHRY